MRTPAALRAGDAKDEKNARFAGGFAAGFSSGFAAGFVVALALAALVHHADVLPAARNRSARDAAAEPQPSPAASEAAADSEGAEAATETTAPVTPIGEAHAEPAVTTGTTAALPSPGPADAAAGPPPPPAPNPLRETENARTRASALAYLGLDGGLDLSTRERCGVVDSRFRRPFRPFGTPFATTNASDMFIDRGEWIEAAPVNDFHAICDGNGGRFLDARHEKDNLKPWTPKDANLPSPFKETPVTLNDIVFVVMTHPKSHHSRAAAQKAGWASYPGLRVHFLSEGSDATLGTDVLDKMPPDMSSKLSKMWAKALHILSHVRTMLHSMNCPKWIVICDDDTFILPRRYAELLSHLDPDVPIHVGSGASGAYAPYGGLRYHEGGPSYAFSWSGLELIADAIDEGLCPVGRCVWPPPYAEADAPNVAEEVRRDVCPNREHAPIAAFGDMSTGVCAHQVGMYVVGMPGLYSQQDKWNPSWGPFDMHSRDLTYPAGLHYVNPELQGRFWDGQMSGFCKLYKENHKKAVAKHAAETGKAIPVPEQVAAPVEAEKVIETLAAQDAAAALKRGEESQDPAQRDRARQRHLRRHANRVDSSPLF